MKAPKSLLAGMLAVSTVGVAQGQTTLHITGSTAFRTATQTAILDMLNNPTVAFTGSSYTGAGAAVIMGTTKSNVNGTNIPVVIQTYWSGSLAGIQAVSEEIGLSTFLSTNNS